MSRKHTPGPWTVEQPKGRQARTTIWKWGPKKALGENVWIATIYCGEVSEEEQQANAALIAAAPRLFGALLALRPLLEEANAAALAAMQEGEPNGDMHVRALSSALSLIAEMEGRA